MTEEKIYQQNTIRKKLKLAVIKTGWTKICSNQVATRKQNLIQS